MFSSFKKLSDISKTQWKFWHWEIATPKKDLGFVDTFEELKTFIDQNVNYEVDYFGLFREGIKPNRSDENNVAGFSLILTDNIKYNDKTYLEYFEKFWRIEIFTFFYVTGIYCTPQKIQIFINFHPGTRPLNDIQNRLKTIRFPFRKICYIRSDSEFTLLSRYWFVGFFHSIKFTLPFNPRFDDNRAYRTNRLEMLIKTMKKQYHITMEEPGLIISSMLLPEEEIRSHHVDNRFIYFKVRASLGEANDIWYALIKLLAFKIFPHLPIITVAFCYYSNDTLEIGVYLTGKPEIFESIKELHRQEANILAVWIGKDIKKLVMEKTENSRIFGRITNAIPPDNLNFCDQKYEFPSKTRVCIEM